MVSYGECEYVHNCEPIWASITYGEPDHWRNLMYANFYCTHSIGPLIHMTGLRPRKVVGFEGTQIERNVRTGAKGGSFGIEMITLENGGIIKSLHGGLYKGSGILPTDPKAVWKLPGKTPARGIFQSCM